MLYLITAPLGTDFNDSNSISWIRVPDENPFFQEFIFIWHFNANLVQNTNIQDDNDSNSQFKIVFEGWIREKWPKMKDMLEISETESWNPISNRANIISLQLTCNPNFFKNERGRWNTFFKIWIASITW